MDSSLRDLLGARYGAAAPEGVLPLNPVLETLLAHRTLRSFDSRPLPEGLAETLVAAAQSAASSSNMQTWSVVVVRDPARRARLAELSANQGFAAKAPLFLAFIADTSRLRRMSERHGEPMEGLDYLELFMVACIDAGLAAQNATVAAESLGLGTCYIGALRNRPEEVAQELGLPPGAVALFGLCVGYADPQAPAPQIKPRLPQSTILHQERYNTAREQEAVESYDATLTAFSLSQGIGPQGWIRRMFTRLGTPAALQGRHRMKEVLRNLGFPLR
ncbi:NADPH-dependent oxidoreductase [Roseomonas marmotae]|uniref:NADPH-dependent oxidoreductase n=1 Tax=Roseomonas marmotae TaxID=2768161 RepID=A0ABS3KGD8_9PROT|nr:NADPH-dependent oxidoreductase [Roseomonas marmotae]MBO1076537.1 NADPH-dependent oxidoreductase [Roseomonas marmotae]QTI81847.1 NADPH-dependent oxidoreductase [Roseomonas marmotae]